MQSESIIAWYEEEVSDFVQLMTLKYITKTANLWLLNVCCVYVWKVTHSRRSVNNI